MKIWILVWRCIILAVIAASSVLLCMCGHKDGGEATKASSDTTVVKPTADDTVSDGTDSQLPILTSDSLGAVRIGMAIDSLPPVCEAFYDSIGRVQECEYEEYIFSRRGKPMFAVIDFGDGKVDLITLLSSEIGVVAGTTELHIGDNFHHLLAQRATQAEWAGYDAVGRWTWTNGGVWYMPDENMGNSAAAQHLLKHLYDSMAAPDPEEFPSHVTIGYIGTGLPF